MYVGRYSVTLPVLAESLAALLREFDVTLARFSKRVDFLGWRCL